MNSMKVGADGYADRGVGPMYCGKVVNIACGERVSLLDILEIVYGLAGKRVLPNFEPGRVGDVRDSLADISLARDLIAYDPKVPFSEGLAQTFAWFRGN